MRTFSQLGLPSTLTDTLARNKIDTPFPIQSATIPDILEGRDVAGRAPTGSGKTLAFGLPILATCGVASSRRPTALILSPTRELAAQIRRDLAPYGKATKRQVFAVYGGVRYQAQRDLLNRGVDVLVATPGRLEDLMEQGAVSLANVTIVAVDEADRMADMGFLPAVRRILDATRDGRQTLLFSATLDGDVGVLVRDYQTDPVRHESGIADPDLTTVDHYFWEVDKADKVRHAAQAVRSLGTAIVFTRTRHGADRLARQIEGEGIRAVAIHGGRTQNQRDRALRSFTNGEVDALIATDVAARGIHVDDVSTVVHFDPPNDDKDYVHRSGRTARAGASGTVVSLVMHSEKRAVRRMQQRLDLMMDIERPRHLKPSAPKREQPKPVEADHSRPRRERTKQVNGSTPSIYVANLPWKTTDAELRSLFSKFGKVSSAEIRLDRRGRSKGVGFVTMPDDAAARAITELQGQKVGGRPIMVRKATPTAAPRR